jgi:hypothetical protein
MKKSMNRKTYQILIALFKVNISARQLQANLCFGYSLFFIEIEINFGGKQRD